MLIRVSVSGTAKLIFYKCFNLKKKKVIKYEMVMQMVEQAYSICLVISHLFIKTCCSAFKFKLVNQAFSTSGTCATGGMRHNFRWPVGPAGCMTNGTSGGMYTLIQTFTLNLSIGRTYEYLGSYSYFR